MSVIKTIHLTVDMAQFLRLRQPLTPCAHVVVRLELQQHLLPLATASHRLGVLRAHLYEGGVFFVEGRSTLVRGGV